MDERLQKVSRTARLKGFRPGKAPIKVDPPAVRPRRCARKCSATAAGELHGGRHAAETDAAARSRDRADRDGSGEDLKYRAVFEVLPEVALDSVDGLEVARPAAEVTEADIDAMVENLRASVRPSTRSSARAATATA